ncbi:MAG: hypothetical protein MSC31_09625 [Solirubrobacteraceae bacterium MAG38_C4-C5]|nr:hypothetical protein [Candidatus Siliceabacter maunaloa]
MIVRIMSEGQFRLADDDMDRLNELDNVCVAAVDGGDREGFQVAFAQLLALVREHGTPVPDDDLVGSDVLVPPPDTSFEEAAADFTGDGLIPG